MRRRVGRYKRRQVSRPTRKRRGRVKRIRKYGSSRGGIRL